MLFNILVFSQFLVNLYAQCFIESSVSQSLCLSCDYRYFYNLTENWSGGDLSFPKTSCQLMLNKSVSIYISPNACNAGSACNGSESSPYDNLIKAFKAGWGTGANELKFYLLSDNKSDETSVHFINKDDFGSDYQYLFRRYYSDIYLSPLYCTEKDIPGCIRNVGLKPTVFIRSQSVYFFVAKNLLISNIIFDGSEIYLQFKGLINDTVKKTQVCNVDFIEGKFRFDNKQCDPSNEESPAAGFAYGLFNVEPPIECTACMKNNEKLLLNNTQFKYFHTFPSDFSLGSIVTFQAIKYGIHILNSEFLRFFLPNGLISSLSSPPFYATTLDKYKTAQTLTQDSFLKFEGSLLKDYNYYNLHLPAGSSYNIFFQQIDILFDINVTNSSFINIRSLRSPIPDQFCSLIYLQLPIKEDRYLSNMTISRSFFQNFDIDYMLQYKKGSNWSIPRPKTVFEANGFMDFVDSCLEINLMDVLLLRNSFRNFSFKACSFLGVKYGQISAFNNNVSYFSDSFSGSFVDFKGPIVYSDQTLFDGYVISNKTFYEAINFDGNSFSEMGLGIIRCNNSLNFFYFTNNIIKNMRNSLMNVTSAKVERDLVISNNSYSNISCFYLIYNECFRNLTLFNNTFIDLNIVSFTKAVLFSSLEPISYILLMMNNFQNITLADDGFQFLGFSDQSGINYGVMNNSIKNLSGAKSCALFTFSFSNFIFSGNYLSNTAFTSCIKALAMLVGPLIVRATNNIFLGHPTLPLEFFMAITNFKELTIGSSIFKCYGVPNLEISLVYAISSLGFITVENCNFQQLSAKTTGALHAKVSTIKNLRIYNCIFYNNSGMELSGDISIELASKSYISLTYAGLLQELPNYGLINNTFSYSRGSKGGAVCLLEGAELVSIGNKFFSTNSSTGGCYYVDQGSFIITFKDRAVWSFTSSAGGFLYAINSEVRIYSTEIFYSTSNKGGSIFVEDTLLFVYNANIINSSAVLGGGALFSQKSILSLFNIKIEEAVSKFDGGGLFIKRGMIKISRATFKENLANSNGGCLYLENLEAIDIYKLELIRSRVDGDGILFITGDARYHYIIEELLCENNEAFSKGECFSFNEGSYMISNIILRNNTVSNCAFCFNSMTLGSSFQLKKANFYNNTVENYIFDIYGFQISVDNLLLKKTYLGKNFVFIMITSSNASFSNIVFEATNNGTRFLKATDSSIFAANISLRLNEFLGAVNALKCPILHFSNVIIYKAKIALAIEADGGAFFISNSVLILLSVKIHFSNSNLGGAIYGKDSSVNLTDCLFFNNTAEVSGSNIYLKNSLVSEEIFYLNIADSFIFENPGITIEHIPSIKLKRVLVTQSRDSFFQKDSKLQRNSILLVDAETIVISECLFRYLITDNTSPIKIKSTAVKANIQISDIKMESCFSSDSGGAIRAEGPVNATIKDSVFFNNTSNQSGGVIFLDSPKETSLFMVDNCSFRGNKALYYGSVLKSLDYQPLMNGSNRINFNFINSYSETSTFSSFPFKLLVLEGYWNLESIKKALQIAENGDLDDPRHLKTIDIFASGRSINTTCVVLDHYNNLMIHDNEGQISFENALPQNQNINFDNEILPVNNGIANFLNLSIIATPNSTYIVTIHYSDTKTQKDVKKNITLFSRICVKGEVYSGGKCEQCKENFYSLEYYPMNASNKTKEACDKCEANSYCPGGSLIYPNEGYWRKDENQTFIKRCRITEACVKQILNPTIDVSLLSYESKCGHKYKGNLCFKCIQGYGKTDNQQCVLCSLDNSFIGRYVLLVIFSLIISAYQIWSAFDVDQHYSKRRCLMKLLVDHFTYIGMISSFNIDWTNTIESILNINNSYLTVVPAEMFNFDCFISNHVDPDEKFFKNSIIVSLSPLIYGSISFLFVYITKCLVNIYNRIKKYKQREDLKGSSEIEQKSNVEIAGIKQNLMVTCLVIFYNFYPRLLMNGMSWLRCTRIDDSDTRYLESEPDIPCWNSKHIKYVVAIALPTMIVWSFLTPLLLFIFTFKTKINHGLNRRSSNIRVIEFVTIDYKEEFYYFDCFCYIFKFLVVLASMLTNNLEPTSQGSLMILMMLMIFLVNEKYRPYKYEFINNMFTNSYIVTICTGAFAIMTSSKDLKSSQRDAYLALLIILNIIFYVAWIYYFIKEGADWKGSREVLREYVKRATKSFKGTIIGRKANNHFGSMYVGEEGSKHNVRPDSQSRILTTGKRAESKPEGIKT